MSLEIDHMTDGEVVRTEVTSHMGYQGPISLLDFLFHVHLLRGASLFYICSAQGFEPVLARERARRRGGRKDGEPVERWPRGKTTSWYCGWPPRK